MATKSTTKSPARKAATTARKPAKTVPHKETPPKAKESKTKAAEKPERPIAPAKEKRASARVTGEAPETTEEKPKSVSKMESVSLIDKPKAKSADGVSKVRTTFLPPISKLVAKPGLTAAPPPPVIEPTPPPPAPVAEVAAVSSTDGQAGEVATPVEEEPKNVITIKPPIIAKELATQLGMKNFQLIKELMDDFNIFVNASQTVEPDIATKIAEKHGFVLEKERREKGGGVHKEEKVVVAPPPPEPAKEEELQARAPIITFMGHVDHGKTSLMDAIRKTRVTAGEAGGITQHIGAYRVEYKGQPITFLDTPGHAAFSAMRMRGATVTDIVVLVVAADDGVMPQTIEAINHAKSAGVPIIVAINKIDKPDADPTRVINELLQHEIVVESLGGDTQAVEVSAKEKMGLTDLIDAILVQAEVLDLKANPDRTADGVVIEAKLDRGRGAVSTVLVKRGTLKRGDIVVAGSNFGRVRALLNEREEQVAEAGPSVPVEILGLDGTPAPGDPFAVVENEARARELTAYRVRVKREKAGAPAQGNSLAEMMSKITDKKASELPLVIKADVQGSVEAIIGSLEKLG